jgi:hypothetical protein
VRSPRKAWNESEVLTCKLFKSSTRRPFHLSPTQDMQVEMINILTWGYREREREHKDNYALHNLKRRCREKLYRLGL